MSLFSSKRGIPTVPGTVCLKKDANNLIGISIGGGAQYCPCLYIVQVGIEQLIITMTEHFYDVSSFHLKFENTRSQVISLKSMNSIQWWLNFIHQARALCLWYLFNVVSVVSQVFDNTPAALDGTLAAGDEITGVNGKPVKGKTKVEVAKMIQAVQVH